MSKYTALSFGLLLAVATGCGSVTEQPTGTTGGGGNGGASGPGSGGNGTGGNGTGGNGTSTGTGILPGDSYSVEFGPVTVAPGKENTQCVVLRLDNPALLHVGQIHNVLTDGSHHLIVYRTNDTVEQLTPFDCQPFSDTLKPEKGSPLMITQKHDELLTLPKGVAFTLQPKQMIRLEMHYVNFNSTNVQIKAKTTFTGITDAEFKNEADFLFLGNPDIKIPAHSKQTLGPTYLALQKPELAGVNVFGITGHTHQWGTNVSVSLADSKAGPDKVLYDVSNWKWSEPETVYQDPPVVIPAGGGFRFSCEWDNKGNSDVKFGESANDEMCFFWAYYYPSKGAFVCAHTDQIGSFDVCCPGSPICDKLFP
jgi:hypothetical protein